MMRMQRPSHAAPARIRIGASGVVGCPLNGPATLDGCRWCTFLQGSLDGPDPSILCGFAHGAPIRPFRDERPWAPLAPTAQAHGSPTGRRPEEVKR